MCLVIIMMEQTEWTPLGILNQEGLEQREAAKPEMEGAGDQLHTITKLFILHVCTVNILQRF